MTGAGLRRQVLQITAAQIRDASGGVRYEPADAFQALQCARQGVDGTRDDRGGAVWAVTQAPGVHPAAPGQFLFLAEARYATPAGIGRIRLGCVSTFLDVAYPDYQGVETLLTLNFEDGGGWRAAQSGALADYTVERVWEALEAWLGAGRVMWEGQ